MKLLRKGLAVCLAALLALPGALPGMAVTAEDTVGAGAGSGEYVVGRFQYDNSVEEKSVGGKGWLGVSVNAPVPVNISGHDISHLALRFSMRVTRSDGVTGPGSLSRLRNGYVDVVDSAGTRRVRFGSPTQNGVNGEQREADTWMDISFPLSAMVAGTDRLTSVTLGDYNDFPNRVKETGEFEFPDGADTDMFLEVRGMRIVDTSMDEQGNPIPRYTLTTFGGFGGVYPYNNLGTNQWYADWKYADVYPVDLSGDRSNYRLQMKVTFAGGDTSVDANTCWSKLTVKLRSSDAENRPNDPDGESNTEHNIGWDFTPKTLPMTDGSALISIDLSSAGTNSRGLIDWAKVERIITVAAPDAAVQDKVGTVSMTLSNVQIVDLTAVESLRQELKKEIDRAQNESLFSAADLAVYQAAREQALAVYKEETSTVAELQNAQSALKAAGLAGDEGKTALRKALAETIDRTVYTEASLQMYDAACQAAQLIADAPGATVAAVNKALAAVNDAKEALEPFSGVRYGDVDGKDGVTSADALLALKGATAQVVLSAGQKAAADVDGVDGVTAVDALLILQYAAQKVSAFPAESTGDLSDMTEVVLSKDPLTFCNPLNLNYEYQPGYNGSREAADPAVVIFKGEYWLFASHNEGYWHSSDLYNWIYVHVAANNPVHSEFAKFAPATVVVDGVLYVTHSEGGSILKSSDPADPTSWVNIGKPYDWGDPGMFLDDDGYVYVYEGLSDKEPIHVSKLDPKNNMKLVEGPVDCCQSDMANRGFERSGDNNESDQRQPFFEGAWMNKYNGKYYLTYAAPGTEYGTYADGCFVSDSPMGPFTYCENSPVIWKATGFMRGAGHGCLFQDLEGKWWKVDTVSISVNHSFERRLALFPAMFDEDGSLYANTVRADYPTYRPTKSENPFFATGPDWQLLSYGKEATASSTLNRGKTVSKAVDENMKTWWSAKTGDVGEYLQIDLGRLYGVWSVQVNFADQDTENNPNSRNGDFSYKYLLEFSQDGETWHTLVDRTQNDSDTSHDYYEFAKMVGMRYVRVTNRGHVPQNGKFAISGLRVFGESTGAKPQQVQDFTVERYEENERSVSLTWDAVPGAQGYIIHFGVNPDALYNHYQVIGGTGVTLNVLNMGVDYYFRIDSYNEGGVPEGTVVKEAKHTKDPVKPDPVEPDPDPDQPTDPTKPGDAGKVDGYTVYEAEQATLEVAQKSGGHVGNMHQAGASITFAAVDGGTGGAASLHVVYASGEGRTSKMKLVVNGETVGTYNMVNTGGWDTFKMIEIPLTGLKAGTANTVQLVGGDGGFNVDYIQVIYPKD